MTVGAARYVHTISKFKETCSMLGMPLDEKKEEGPAEVLTFLGMELDCRKGEVRLLVGRERSQEEITGMEGYEIDLLSVIGHLSHACKAFRAGRSFLWRLLDLIMTVTTDAPQT